MHNHQILFISAVLGLVMTTAGCRTPQDYREQADEVAYGIIARTQEELFGAREEFTVQPPAEDLRQRLLLDQDLPYAFRASLGRSEVEAIPQLPEKEYLTAPSAVSAVFHADDYAETVQISLEEALQTAAYSSREYQSEKEQVFFSALALDLERDDFRKSWFAFLRSEASTDLGGNNTVSGVNTEAGLELTRLFRHGMLFTAKLGVNLAQLLTGGKQSSLGIFGDASVSIPLLRGAGEFVVTEPLTQAERDVVYALYNFQRFRRVFAVRVAAEYFGVLEQLDRVQNAEHNYRGLIASARRARRLADVGNLPEIQVDQAVQDELRARDRWVSALLAYERGLDNFKILLGLPTDARIRLDSATLQRLSVLSQNLIPEDDPSDSDDEPVPADAPIHLQPPSRENGGPYEIPAQQAVQLALEKRLDFRVAIAQIDDAQRAIAIAADALRADLTLLGRMSLGERRSLATAGLPDAGLRFSEGRYAGIMHLDLPLERTFERSVYRRRWINLQRVVRNAQQQEDSIKFAVRNNLRTLLEARETVQIQARAVQVAQRRVRSTEMFLELGRVQIRDVLEARESLISAENALTAAIVRYRVAELEFQRDLGVLQVGPDGLWQEFDPNSIR